MFYFVFLRIYASNYLMKSATDGRGLYCLSDFFFKNNETARRAGEGSRTRRGDHWGLVTLTYFAIHTSCFGMFCFLFYFSHYLVTKSKPVVTQAKGKNRKHVPVICDPYGGFLVANHTPLGAELAGNLMFFVMSGLRRVHRVKLAWVIAGSSFAAYSYLQ